MGHFIMIKNILFNTFSSNGSSSRMFSSQRLSIAKSSRLSIATGSRLSKTKSSRLLSLLVVFALTIASASSSAQSILADDFPDRYTVVKGDTLWDISGKFLRDPWRWPEVWQGNPQVENPDLIFPGDVLVLTFVDGRPVLRSLRRETVRLSPKPRVVDFSSAIPLIDPGAIQAYITAPLVTDENELRKAGYIADGFDSRLLMGKYDKFYARNIENQDVTEFRLFRSGRRFIDPISKELLGWEAVHVGDANMINPGDPAKLVISRSYQDVTIRDRLRPVLNKRAPLFYYPKAPDNENLRGVILETPNKSAELGALSVVTLNLGEREGVQNGDVFRVLSQRMQRKDPITNKGFEIPEENVGLALVFRTFEKVSYALITNSNRQILPGDILVSPNADTSR